MVKQHRILIVGGGFAGVRAARQLAHRRDVNVSLMSDKPDFAYYPQLYHAATGGARSEASLPLAQLLQHMDVHIITDTAQTLDPFGKTLTGISGAKYGYDELIIAVGSITNYFGIPGLKEFAFDIKTIEGAQAFKDHLHTQLIGHRKPELHYVIVGGGATGVELAGSLTEYMHRILSLHNITRPKFSIDLVEAAPRLLPRSPEPVARRVTKRLEKLGVTIHTDTTVQGQTAQALQLKGKSIKSTTVVWTSGVANNPFFHDNTHVFELAKNGRVVVNDRMEAGEHIYVIGDNAYMQYGGLAETAINDANFVARDILHKIAGESRKMYHQPKPASVIPVGPGWAAAEYKGMRFYGRIGWILRRAADLIAYNDVEATNHAISAWIKETTHEDDCNVCLQMRPAA